MNPNDIQFIALKNGKLGVGYCPDRDRGGFQVIKWVPDDMLRAAYAELLSREIG